MNCGIYQIKCVKNNKIYIGSSRNIKERWRKHISKLKNNNHVNSYLQNCWNKYGREHFEFSILEEVDETNLITREQYWLDKLLSYNRSIGFNMCHIAKNFIHCKRYILISPEEKHFDIIDLKNFAKNNNLDSTCLCRVAQGVFSNHKGWHCRYYEDSYEEWLNKRQRSDKSGPGWKGSYKIYKNDGSQIVVRSLYGFAKKNNLSQPSLYALCVGKIKKYKDFTKIDKICA